MTDLNTADRIIFYFPGGYAKPPNTQACSIITPVTGSENCTYTIAADGYIDNIMFTTPCLTSSKQCIPTVG